MRKTLAAFVASVLAAAPTAGAQQAPAPYLYVWAGDADTLDSDFLAVIDVRPGSPTYARVVSTLPVGARATIPHHTEHQLELDHQLFANGFRAGRTFRFDLTRPDQPRLLGSFTEVGGYSYPHSFVQLPDGHLLGHLPGARPGQHSARRPRRTRPRGPVHPRHQRPLRPCSTALQMRPYSLAVLPAIDRVVSTSTDMIGRLRRAPADLAPVRPRAAARRSSFPRPARATATRTTARRTA